MRTSADGALVRAFGTWALAASIVNLTVGGGIFRLPAAGAESLGAAAPVAYIVCAIAMGLIVVCVAEAGSRVTITGGLYAYVGVAFGPFVGFVAGIMLWAGLTAATAAVASFVADALGMLVPALAGGTARTVTLVAFLAGLAALNVAGVRGASRFITFMTIAKLLPLAVLVIAGAGAIHRENLVWTGVPPVHSVGRGSAVLIFAFLGVESALMSSGEVKDPSRTVPKAIFIALIGVTVLYLAVQIVTQGILGPGLPGQKTPLAAAGAVALGAPGRTLILVGSALAMFGHVSGMTLSVPRILFAFGRDGFLPARFAAVHERFRTPVLAIVLQTILVAALALSGSFEALAIISNSSVLLVYAACCIGVLELRRRDVRESGEPFRVPFARVIPIAAVAIIAWLLTNLTAGEWKALLVLLAVAVALYLASVPSRRAAAARARTAA